MAAYHTLSDNELVALLKDSGHAAFNELYERYSGLLYTYAFKLTGDEDKSRDFLQELFISLWDRRGQLALRGSVAAYLYSGIRYQFLNEVQRAKTRTVYATAFLEEFGQELPADDYIGEKELVALIELYVRDLPPQMARVFTLSRFQHRTNQEIADELDISEKTVRNLLSGALKDLKPKVGAALLLALLHICK